jgi:hypothetical protein
VKNMPCMAKFVSAVAHAGFRQSWQNKNLIYIFIVMMQRVSLFPRSLGAKRLSFEGK